MIHEVSIGYNQKEIDEYYCCECSNILYHTKKAKTGKKITKVIKAKEKQRKISMKNDEPCSEDAYDSMSISYSDSDGDIINDIGKIKKMKNSSECKPQYKEALKAKPAKQRNSQRNEVLVPKFKYDYTYETGDPNGDSDVEHASL